MTTNKSECCHLHCFTCGKVDIAHECHTPPTTTTEKEERSWEKSLHDGYTKFDFAPQINIEGYKTLKSFIKDLLAHYKRTKEDMKYSLWCFLFGHKWWQWVHDGEVDGIDYWDDVEVDKCQRCGLPKKEAGIITEQK
jgi:hypothetical protein